MEDLGHDELWLAFLACRDGPLGFCGWLALSQYGSVRLGDPGEQPEFRELSWAAMMFTAGIGIGLVSWAFVEPVYYLVTPPLGIESGTAAAMEWGHAYAQFHWGFIPWAFYALPRVFPSRIPCMSEKRLFCGLVRRLKGCYGTPKQRQWWSPLIDTLVIIGIIGGAGTSLGLGVPLVGKFFWARLTGIESGMTLNLAVLAVWTLIFGTSVYRGLKAGIRRLADINIFLAVFVVVFVLLAGPTVFILSLSVNSVGLMLNNFAHMSFWLDPIEQGGFPEDWTIFYWAWWIAYAPLMGLFFGRISRGRTIRQGGIGNCWLGFARNSILYGGLRCLHAASRIGRPFAGDPNSPRARGRKRRSSRLSRPCRSQDCHLGVHSLVVYFSCDDVGFSRLCPRQYYHAQFTGRR
ncbi:MAG: hypothetical protein CM1200mP9_06490 [Gammaproteobacteria bacterium]|nr:MAG: hypothetical protein CM1200mP9_06490 [Gammaproteobacteria bacterium]